MGQLLVTLIVPPIGVWSPTLSFYASGIETRMVPGKHSAGANLPL